MIDKIAVIYEEEVQAFGEEKGRRVTNDEMDTILDGILDPVILQGRFFGGPGPFFDDPPQPLVTVRVPDEFVASLTTQFRATNNRNPSELELKQAYVDFLERENQ